MTTSTDPIRSLKPTEIDVSAGASLPQAAAPSHNTDTLKSARESEGCLDWLLPSCVVSYLRYIGSWFTSLWDCLFENEKGRPSSLRKQRTLYFDTDALKKTPMQEREKGESEDEWIVRSEFSAGINLPSPAQMVKDIEAIMNKMIIALCDQDEPSKLEALFPCRIVIRADLRTIDLKKEQGGLNIGKLGSLYQKGEVERLQTDLEEFRDLLTSQEGKVRHYKIEFMHIQKKDDSRFQISYSVYGCQMDSPSLVRLPEFSRTVTSEELHKLFSRPDSIQATDLITPDGTLSSEEL